MSPEDSIAVSGWGDGWSFQNVIHHTSGRATLTLAKDAPSQSAEEKACELTKLPSNSSDILDEPTFLSRLAGTHDQ